MTRVRSLRCALGLTLALGMTAAADTPPRPRVLGLSHVALRVSSVAASRRFYQDFLGMGWLQAAPSPDPSAPVFVVVSDRQYIELRPGLVPDEDRLDHVAFQVDDVEAARATFASRAPSGSRPTPPGPMGTRGFLIEDTEDHRIGFVSHPAGGWPAKGAVAGDAPISGRILHAGVLVGDLEPATRFYEDVLGFRETWRGSRSGTVLSWTNMRVPDGTDYVEFMLYAEKPAPDARGTPHHICLEVTDVEAARVRLQERATSVSYTRPLEVRIGTNRRRQLNLFDPDGTRVELMEPNTVDGQPVPSSTAPPPRPASLPPTP